MGTTNLAEVAELADALDLGSSAPRSVKVRLLSSATNMLYDDPDYEFLTTEPSPEELPIILPGLEFFNYGAERDGKRVKDRAGQFGAWVPLKLGWVDWSSALAAGWIRRKRRPLAEGEVMF